MFPVAIIQTMLADMYKNELNFQGIVHIYNFYGDHQTVTWISPMAGLRPTSKYIKSDYNNIYRKD
jgi:hypothetical protein